MVSAPITMPDQIDHGRRDADGFRSAAARRARSPRDATISQRPDADSQPENHGLRLYRSVTVTLRKIAPRSISLRGVARIEMR